MRQQLASRFQLRDPVRERLQQVLEVTGPSIIVGLIRHIRPYAGDTCP
jgi:hypothetical protein